MGLILKGAKYRGGNEHEDSGLGSNKLHEGNLWWKSEEEWQAVAGVVLEKRSGEEEIDREADSHMNRCCIAPS